MTPCACVRFARQLLAALHREFTAATIERLYGGTEAP